MTRRNRTRTILALAIMVTTLLVLPATAMAQGAEDPAFGAARESAEIAAYTISKVQRWLHEVALEKIEPDSGLYHPDGNFNYQDAWADCYPFLVWAAWLTDLDALNGPVRGALHAEIKHCEQGFFTDPKNTFGGSEYVKDGLIAIVEVTGRDEWFDRMQAVQDEIWAKPTIDTKYGQIPSTNIEVVMKAKSEWSGKLAFDIPRHRIYMGFKHDWPRMNTMPEWFTVEPSQTYVVKNITRGSQETYTGQQLHEGLLIELQPGQESLLLVIRYAKNMNGQ